MFDYRPKPVLDDIDSEPGLGLNFQNTLRSQEEHDSLSHPHGFPAPPHPQASYLKGLLINKGL